MNYPTINLKHLESLSSIIEQAAGDPAYLDPANCPYDEKTIETIRNILLTVEDVPQIARDTVRGDRPKRGRPTKGPAIDMAEVEKEVDEIRKELGELKIDGQTMETSDRIQIIKTRAALIERIITMKERVTDVKKYHAFVQNVISIMQDKVEPEAREEIILELSRYVEH